MLGYVGLECRLRVGLFIVGPVTGLKLARLTLFFNSVSSISHPPDLRVFVSALVSPEFHALRWLQESSPTAAMSSFPEGPSRKPA